MEFHTFDDASEDWEVVLRNPPRQHAPWVRWTLTGVGGEDLLREQLHWMSTNGIGGVLIEASLARPTTGPAAPIFHTLSRALERLDALGLRAWLDLQSFSPPALPEGEFSHLRIHRWVTEPGKWRKVRFADTVLYAAAFPEPRDLTTYRQADAMDVTQALQQFATPAGVKGNVAYHVFVFTEHGPSPGETSALSPLNLESALEAVDLVLSDYLGGAVEGIVMQVSPPRCSEEVLPWSPGLEDRFRDDHRYDLLPCLTSLFLETSVFATRARQDFWQTWFAAHTEGTWRPLKGWCSQRKLKLVGKIGEVSQDQGLFHTCTHVASLTHIFDGWLLVPDWGQKQRPIARLLSSFSRQQGRSLSIDVSSTGRPLHACLSQFAAEEVNRWITHRATDCSSPSISDSVKPGRGLFPSHPEAIAAQTSACRRMAFLLNSTVSAKQVAVLLPTRSTWSAPLGRDDELFGLVEQDFLLVAQALEEMHFNFDLVCEEDFIHADIDEGSIHLGPMSYAMLVLPSITALSCFAWAKVMDFVKHGGKAAAFGLLPRTSERGDDEELVSRITADTRTNVRQLYESYQETLDANPSGEVYPVFCEDLSEGRFCTFQPRLCLDAEDARLRMHQIFRESFAPELESQHDSLRYQRRIHHDEEAVFDRHLFLMRNAGKESLSTKAQLAPLGEADQMDLETGEISPIRLYSWLGDQKLAVPVVLLPGEERVLRVHERQVGPRIEASNFEVESIEISPASVRIRGFSLLPGQQPTALLETGSQRVWLRGTELASEPVHGNVDAPWTLTKSRKWKPITEWQFRLKKTAGSVWSRVSKRQQATWRDVSTDTSIVLDRSSGHDTIQYRSTFELRTQLPELELLAEPTYADPRYFFNGKPLSLEDFSLWGMRWKKGSLQQ
ncbi:MAG: hypothetical protein HY318_17595, partial [Armatimonadetes bacterium]|nr:hypothetical protein [Armatimonadota bacterium]